MALNNVSIVTILAVINRKGMKNNSLVFYDPQISRCWSVSQIIEMSQGGKVTSMKVDRFLMNNDFVKDLLRMI